jgi:hypothetical protein
VDQVRRTVVWLNPLPVKEHVDVEQTECARHTHRTFDRRLRLTIGMLNSHEHQPDRRI